MRDLICEVTNYYASSIAMGKQWSVYDKIVIKNLKGEEMDVKQTLTW